MESPLDVRQSGPTPSDTGNSDKRVVMQITWSFVAGGAEMYAFSLASNLDRNRYHVILCALDQGGALEPEICRSGIPYFVMHRRPGIQLGLMWKLFLLFRKTGVEVVHTHHFNQLFYSAIGARLAGARLIHTEHSVEFCSRWDLRLALRLLCGLCDKVVAVGSHGERTLRQRVGIPPHKLRVIPGGVKLSNSSEPKYEARRTLGLSQDARVATIVARLYPEKNHRMLLSAFDAVRRHVPGAQLLIVGEGVEETAISAEISRLGLTDLVHMLGVRRDISRILAASDVFLLSSHREAFPIAVLEAMAAELPVIATAVGDLPSILEDGVTGRLIGPGDTQAFACAIIDVLNDPVGARRMGRQARRSVAAFGLAKMVENYEALYAGNVARQRPPAAHCSQVGSPHSSATELNL
jgi:glycosyltransferase involved in cell wall biosynthesis